MTKTKRPIKNPPPGLRQRWRARTRDWRVWWEPNATQRAAGFEPVELDGEQPTWSVREAERLNMQAGRAKTTTRPKYASPSAHSIDTVCAMYLQSPKFLRLAEKTRKEYRKDVTRILDKWSGTDMRQLTKPVVFTWYEALFAAHGLYVSRRLVKMLSILMSYAELRGIVATNPLYRMQMITPKGRRRTATWAEFDWLDTAAIELGEDGVRLAMYLSMFMGQRETDACQARAMDFIDGEVMHWKLVRSKDTTLQRQNLLLVHEEVKPLLLAAIEGAAHPHSRLVTRRTDGAPFNDETFPRAFAAVREQAARSCPSVADLQFRDLRRTFSDNARHAGVASDDVDDALGNTSGTDPSLRQVYMPASDDRAAAAINAIVRPSKPARKRSA